MNSPESDADRGVLVTDFDGTITQRDFYQVYLERLLPDDAPDFWAKYLAGQINHFEALRAIFSYVPAGEEALAGLTREMHLEPALPTALELLRQAGWNVVVVSAGCRWYIDLLLREAAVSLEVHANPGRIDDAGRLIMEWPHDSPFQS